MDLRGIEPRPRPCHGRVLPMNYRPSLYNTNSIYKLKLFSNKIRKGGGAAPLTILSFSLATFKNEFTEQYNQMINHFSENKKKKPTSSKDVVGSSGSAQSLWSTVADVNERHLHGKSLATDRAVKPLRCWPTQKPQKASDHRADFNKHVMSPFTWFVMCSFRETLTVWVWTYNSITVANVAYMSLPVKPNRKSLYFKDFSGFLYWLKKFSSPKIKIWLKPMD